VSKTKSLQCPSLVSVSSLVAFVLVAASLAGCAHPQAKTITAVPDVPLDVPAPPPRALEPITAAALPQLGPVNEEPPGPAVTRPARPTPPAQPAPRADTASPTDASKAADDAASRPAVPAPAAPTLQTTPAQQEGELEARIRGVITRASSDLGRVDYGRLSTNAKSQYDSAKRFVSLSEEAIRARNLVFAGTLADKAAELAAQLAGR
jgi:hypothetical protein